MSVRMSNLLARSDYMHQMNIPVAPYHRMLLLGGNLILFDQKGPAFHNVEYRFGHGNPDREAGLLVVAELQLQNRSSC